MSYFKGFGLPWNDRDDDDDESPEDQTPKTIDELKADYVDMLTAYGILINERRKNLLWANNNYQYLGSLACKDREFADAMENADNAFMRLKHALADYFTDDLKKKCSDSLGGNNANP